MLDRYILLLMYDRLNCHIPKNDLNKYSMPLNHILAIGLLYLKIYFTIGMSFGVTGRFILQSYHFDFSH